MDDGCFSDNKCIISTDGFRLDDILFLQRLLYNTFNIKSTLKNGSKILISKISTRKFFLLINPYIIQSMRYKIFDPVTTSRIKNTRDGVLKTS